MERRKKKRKKERKIKSIGKVYRTTVPVVDSIIQLLFFSKVKVGIQ